MTGERTRVLLGGRAGVGVRCPRAGDAEWSYADCARAPRRPFRARGRRNRCAVVVCTVTHPTGWMTVITWDSGRSALHRWCALDHAEGRTLRIGEHREAPGRDVHRFGEHRSARGLRLFDRRVGVGRLEVHEPVRRCALGTMTRPAA